MSMFEIVPKIKIHGDFYVRMQGILGSHVLLTQIPTGNLSHPDFRILYICSITHLQVYTSYRGSQQTNS